MTRSLDAVPQVHAEDRAAWRAWLEANHATARSVWLVTWRVATRRPTISYEAAVEEAVCFGWIDSRSGNVDAERTRLYFTPRRPRSAWSDSNRARVERMQAAGLMAPSGVAAVERARADGTWEPHKGSRPAR